MVQALERMYSRHLHQTQTVGSTDGAVPTQSHTAGGRGLLIPALLRPGLALPLGAGEDEPAPQLLDSTVSCVCANSHGQEAKETSYIKGEVGSGRKNPFSFRNSTFI